MTEVRTDAEDLQAGSILGPYELIAPIGAGGMATVWAARVRGTKDVVALKMLLPELAENVEFRKMFLDEARIASRVRHPNVCSTFQMGEQDGVLFLAMQWLDGPSLIRVLRPGTHDVTECDRVPIRPRIAARIVADACAGLHAAHELLGEDGRPLGVVHRDMSPHNLLITSAGSVKVTDFGVAKALGKSHMTIAGQLKGKLAYMAPEQLTGGFVDRRADVFALGCVLYEITTGQRPFQGEHDPQVMTSIVLGRYEPPAAIIPQYPHELAIVVMRALANDPQNRYASAEQMRLALEAYLRNSGPAVGDAQIAALIRERCGEELEQRARALRDDAANPLLVRTAPTAWVPAAVEAAGGLDSGSGAMMVEGGDAPVRRNVFVVLTAALLGIVLGVGVLSYVHGQRKARADRVRAEASASAAASAQLAAIAAERASAAAAAASAGATRGRVHLRATPDTAVLILDGVVLPRGADIITKPDPGKTMLVLVRADKYDDRVVVIDSSSPPELDVTLTPATPEAPRPMSSSRKRLLDAGAKPLPKDPADPPESPGENAPPNPYE
ncbi:MAG: serine/threonine protein kinase [Labilithrix sp.]|nr:serine/threonine protein kinase [Labilithrix sp.]